MRFEGDIPAFEAECLRLVRESLGELSGSEGSPFRDLLSIEMQGQHPDTSIVLMVRDKATGEEERWAFPIWGPDSAFEISGGFHADEGERNIWASFIER